MVTNWRRRELEGDLQLPRLYAPVMAGPARNISSAHLELAHEILVNIISSAGVCTVIATVISKRPTTSSKVENICGRYLLPPLFPRLLPFVMIKLFSLKQQGKDEASQQTSQRSTAAFLRVQKGRKL